MPAESLYLSRQQTEPPPGASSSGAGSPSAQALAEARRSEADRSLRDLPPDRQRALAQEMARAEPDLTGGALAARFGRRERWGRMQLSAARTNGNGTRHAEPGAARTNGNGMPAPTPSGTADGTPAPTLDSTTGGTPAPARQGGMAGKRRDHQRRAVEPRRTGVRHAGRAERWTVILTGLALGVVVLSPIVLSFHSLAGWGREALGLVDPWAYLVPVTLDCAALVCVGLTSHSMLRGDSAGAARLLVWVFTGASSVANWRHGTTISPDAAVYYPAMPLISGTLLDITLRRMRRSVLADLGALERPLPRYRAARWIVAPAETWRAWRTAVTEGITDPDHAVELARQTHAARRSAGQTKPVGHHADVAASRNGHSSKSASLTGTPGQPLTDNS